MGFLISVKDPKTNSYNLGAPPADFKKCGMESNWGPAEATTATGGRFKSSAGSVSVSPGSPFVSPDGGDGGGATVTRSTAAAAQDPSCSASRPRWSLYLPAVPRQCSVERTRR